MRPADKILFRLAATAAIALTAAPLAAQMGPWGTRDRGFGNERDWNRPTVRGSQRDPREGKVEVNRFFAADAELARGPITVTLGWTGDENPVDKRQGATFAAAVETQLVGAGYDTLTRASLDGGQTAELRVLRTVAEPAEAPHRPISGEMDVGVSNRGSAVGMAINLDLTKPRAALVATVLQARIRDAAGAVVWEGRASIDTREGDDKWDDGAIAERLATALFAGFPGKSGESIGAG